MTLLSRMMKYRYQKLNPDNTREIAPKGHCSVYLFCVSNNPKPWIILMQVYTLTVKGRLAMWCLIFAQINAILICKLN